MAIPHPGNELESIESTLKTPDDRSESPRNWRSMPALGVPSNC